MFKASRKNPRRKNLGFLLVAAKRDRTADLLNAIRTASPQLAQCLRTSPEKSLNIRVLTIFRFYNYREFTYICSLEFRLSSL